jgi:hypothetical protein
MVYPLSGTTLKAFYAGTAINGTHKTTGDSVHFLQLLISGVAQGCIYGLIALGFVLRAISGAIVLYAHISPWLYIVTLLAALFLGLCKRRHELLLLSADAARHRRPGAGRYPWQAGASTRGENAVCPQRQESIRITLAIGEPPDWWVTQR